MSSGPRRSPVMAAMRFVCLNRSRTPHSDAIPFWIELFDHETKAALDSYGGYDLAETVAAAEALISQAKSLHLHSAPRAKPSIQ